MMLSAAEHWGRSAALGRVPEEDLGEQQRRTMLPAAAQHPGLTGPQLLHAGTGALQLGQLLAQLGGLGSGVTGPCWPFQASGCRLFLLLEVHGGVTPGCCHFLYDCAWLVTCLSETVARLERERKKGLLPGVRYPWPESSSVTHAWGFCIKDQEGECMSLL